MSKDKESFTYKIDFDDLEDFAPESKKATPEEIEMAKRVSEESGFHTKHAQQAPSAGLASEPKRRGRKRTTNRNVAFSVKLRLETNDLIYSLAEKLDSNAIAEVLELALDCLVRDLENGIDVRKRAGG